VPPGFPDAQGREWAPRGEHRPQNRQRVRVPHRRHRLRRAAIRLLLAFVVLQLLLAGFIGSLRWWTPPRTAFMLEGGSPVTYQYVSLDHVSRYLLASVIAHEDEQLGTRRGAVTWAELRKRAGAWVTGAPDPSGSTIPQQLAKNVFLWPDQDPVRKAVEAWLATGMSYELSDQRELELYVNYAQFGPHLYGICAASWYYFGQPPSAMTLYQAAQLMGVLPDPDRVRRAPGGGIDLGPTADPQAVDLVNGAANVHLPRELAGMGGWQAAVETVGIHDTAAEHAATASAADGCSTMPTAVAALLAGG
jgi:monofunctional biosynthetic peptidoglycan transglycosylase